MKPAVGVYRGPTGLHVISDEDGVPVFYRIESLSTETLEAIFLYQSDPDHHEPPVMTLVEGATQP